MRHPAAISPVAADGRVTLSGPVLRDEVEQLIEGIRSVPGVKSLDNRLAVHENGAQVPGLRGEKPRRGCEVWDIMQRNWSPATRFVVGAAGAASAGLIAYALSDGARERRKPGRERRALRLGRRLPAPHLTQRRRAAASTTPVAQRRA